MPEYDAITPTQWVIFLWVAMIAFSIMWWLFWHVGRGDTPIELSWPYVTVRLWIARWSKPRKM